MYFTQKDFFLTSKMVYYRYDIVQFFRKVSDSEREKEQP